MEIYIRLTECKFEYIFVQLNVKEHYFVYSLSTKIIFIFHSIIFDILSVAEKQGWEISRVYLVFFNRYIICFFNRICEYPQENLGLPVIMPNSIKSPSHPHPYTAVKAPFSGRKRCRFDRPGNKWLYLDRRWRQCVWRWSDQKIIFANELGSKQLHN